MLTTRRSVVFLLITTLLLFSCKQNEQKVEYKKTFHRNGKLFEVIPHVDGKIHGIKLEYYDDGALRKETPYDSGYVHGIVKFYYPNGKLFSETPRVNGKINGNVVKYHKNGIVQSETPYLNDVLLPGLKEYNQRGVLQEAPTIVFLLKKEKRHNDLIVTLEARLSSGQKSVKFSQAVQMHDQGNTFIAIPSEDGVGKLEVRLPKGSSIDNIVLLRAEFITAYRNRCIVEGAYRLVAST